MGERVGRSGRMRASLVRACAHTVLGIAVGGVAGVLGALAPGTVRAGEAVGAGAERPVGDAPLRAPPPVAPDQVLPGFDASGPLQPASAREALQQLPQARSVARDALVRERIACYRRFFVNRCLDDVASRERQLTARLDAIEVAARQSLREEAAYERSVREAERLAQAARTAEADAARRQANREAFEARQAADAEERARREREAPELERRAAANRIAREKREAAVAERQAQAARRAAQAPANAAERARTLEAQERRRAANEAREEARRERRREDAQRRREAAEEQRQRAEQRDARAKRDGSPPNPSAPTTPTTPTTPERAP